jgi:hypothetical protein
MRCAKGRMLSTPRGCLQAVTDAMGLSVDDDHLGAASSIAYAPDLAVMGGTSSHMQQAPAAAATAAPTAAVVATAAAPAAEAAAPAAEAPPSIHGHAAGVAQAGMPVTLGGMAVVVQ